MLKRYKQAERNSRGADAYHGDAGPLCVEDLPSPHPMVHRFVRAGREEGIPENDDFNGPTQEGLGNYQTTMHRSRRFSPADAYLRPALSRGNLTVLTSATADRLLIEQGRATAVRFRTGAGERTIAARAEVILSAGS